MKSGWNLVFLAGGIEIGWVIGLNYAYNWWSWILTIIAIYLSMHLLVLGSRTLPVGSTYAVFTGIGTTGTVLMEILVFRETIEPLKIFLILLLLLGIIGLKTITTENKQEGGEV